MSFSMTPSWLYCWRDRFGESLPRRCSAGLNRRSLLGNAPCTWLMSEATLLRQTSHIVMILRLLLGGLIFTLISYAYIFKTSEPTIHPCHWLLWSTISPRLSSTPRNSLPPFSSAPSSTPPPPTAAVAARTIRNKSLVSCTYWTRLGT